MLLLLFTCQYAISADFGFGSIAARHYEGLIRRRLVTGAAFGAVEHGEVRETAFFGQGRQDSLWRAASTAKAFTAIGVMRLVERGQLELDADANRYLKTFRLPAGREHPISIRHLLSHTSGLDDPFVGSGFLDSAGAQPLLANVMRNALPRPVYGPGEVYFYTNFGYGILGALIEDVTGRRFEEYMRAEVLEPLGMHDSTFQQPVPEEMRRRIVPSLERTVFGFTRPARLIYHRSTAGGGLTTSLRDLIRFVQFVQNKGYVDGRQVLLPQTLDRMLRGETDRMADSENLGFASGINRGERYWYCGGDLGGFHTVLLWFPDHGRALVTTAASSSEMATWGLVPKVIERWFGAEGKMDSAAKTTPIPQTRELARHVAGMYRPVRYPHFDLAKTFVITMDRVVKANPDGSLRYGGERWIAVAPLRFRQENGTRYLTFHEDTRGRARFMDRSAERVARYQSGRAGIAFYFGFLILSISALFVYRDDPIARPLHWTAWAILIHSFTWLGAVLVADPQRLILGLPWYLISALAFAAVVPLIWVLLAVATAKAILTATSPLSFRLTSMLATVAFAFYVPFILYWRLIILPPLGINIW